MYIAMWSSVNHTIARADLDGQNFNVIATLGNTGPQGLVLDSAANQLCWVEEKAKTISCLSLSTFMVRKLADVPYAVALTSMALQGDYFWVTDRGNYSIKGSVYKCSKASGTCTTFLKDQNNPRGIVANSTVFKGTILFIIYPSYTYEPSGISQGNNCTFLSNLFVHIHEGCTTAF